MALTTTEVPAGTQLVYSPHPLLAAADRQLIVEPFEPGETIAAYLSRLGIHLGNQPVVLMLDGDIVLREYWAMTVPRPGSMITVRAVVHDGGGGGSNPARAILTIAVIVAAVYTGGYAAIMTGSVYAQAAAGAAVMYAGMAVVNSLVPVPQPELANLGDNGKASPTYALSGGGNRARAHEPMPLLVGKHRVFPDLSSQPYTEYDGEDQYLYQVFNFGLAYQRLTDFMIGDTLVTDYSDAELFVSGIDGRIDGFPGNVDSLSVGATLDSASGWIQRTSSLNTTRLAVDLVGSLFRVGDNGITQHQVEIGAEYRAVGDTTWLPLIGSGQYQQASTAYWSNGYYDGGTGPWIQVAYGSTNSNEHTAGDTGQYKFASWRWRPYAELVGQFADDPAPAPGDEVALAIITLKNKTRKPVRRSLGLAVPRGQYEVRVRRSSPDDTSDKNVSDFSWTVLRSYQPDDTDYTGQQRVGIKVRASAQLSGVLGQFNAVAEGWYPDWDGSTEVRQPTQNPASLFLWFARGQTDANLDRLFGAGLPDSRIDIPAMREWHTWCAAKGLTCNLVIDRRMACADVLAAIARCGRATFTWANGLLSVIWDQANQPETAVFGMSNIVAGSFKVDYVTEKLADEIVVRFINPALGWQQDTVRVNVPGVSSPERPVTIDLWGCTDKVMAGKTANLFAAAQIYHRRRVSWETDIEGQVAVRGDVVRLSHDMTQWGYSGRLVAGTTNQLTLDEAVPFTNGQSHYVSLRQPDGTWSTHPINYTAGESAIVTITAGSELPVAPDAGRPVDWLWFFAPEPTPGKQVKIVDARPVSEDRWRFTAIDEEAAYYAAEGGTFIHVPVSIQLPSPEITGLDVSETVLNYQDNTVQVHITWRLRGSEKARVRIGIDGGDLQDYGEHAGGYLDAVFTESSQLVIEVTAVVLAQLVSDPAAVATTQYTVGEYTLATADPLPVPADVTGLELDGLDAEQGQGNATEFTGRDIKLVWRKSATQRAYELGQEPRGGDSGQLDGTYDGYRVRVYHGSQFDQASLIREEHVRTNRFDYLFEMNADDGLSRLVSVEVVGLDIYGKVSDRPARLTVNNPAPELPLGVSVDPRFQHFRLRYTEPADLDFEGIRVWVGTTSGFTADNSTRVFDGPGELVIIDSLADGTALVTGGIYYMRFAPYDAFGRTGLHVSAEYQVTLQAIDPADTQGFSDWAFKLDPADKAWIVTHLQADSVDSTRIESLVASKIAAGILKATIEIQSGGMIRATNSGTDYEYRTGFESDGGTDYIIRYGNLITSHFPFTMDVNGNIAMEGSLTFRPGTTGIANVADAGALAGQDDVDWQLQVTGASKPQDNATVGATWGGDIGGQPADTDLLNAMQAWADISGTGKPQDNATLTALGNILVNGTGDWGDNTNWNQWVWESDGSFSTTDTAQKNSDQYIPVITNISYKLESEIKTQDASTVVYAGFTCYDKNKIYISYDSCWRDTNKNTTLYAPTSSSSNIVDIVPAAESWFDVTTPFSYIQFDIKSDGSDLPQINRSIKILSIDTSAGTYWRLTLAANAPGNYAAGTPVGNSHSGSSSNYNLASGTVGTAFVRKTGRILGKENNVNEPPPANKFRKGTQYIRHLVLPNRTVVSKTYIRNSYLAELPDESLVDALALQNGPAQAGADVTAANTAADTDAVAGSSAAAVRDNAANGATFTSSDAGALATLDVADWATHVGGTGKPADGADVTNYNDSRVSNVREEGSTLTVARPVGASLSVTSSTATGAIVITLPQSFTNTMLRFAVDVFLYDTSQSFTAAVGGYNNLSGTQWINEFARIFGSVSGNNRVRFGHDGTKCVVVIGDTTTVWRYPKITVRDFQAGHSNYQRAKWESGWAISLQTSLAGYTFTGDFSDALLDAKSIKGQGALATKSNVDLASLDVVNKSADYIAESASRKFAGESGADKTKTVIETGLAVTAGAITYGTNIVLDFLNKFIGIGTAWWSTTTANISLDHNNGNPRAYIGDGAESYLLFDSASNKLVLGEDVLFNGGLRPFFGSFNVGTSISVWEQPTGWTTTRIGTGKVRITHNLGLSDLQTQLKILLTQYDVGNGPLHVYVNNIGINYFDVYIATADGAAFSGCAVHWMCWYRPVQT